MGRGKETITVKLENVPITMDHNEDTTVPSEYLYFLTILTTTLTLLPLG